MDRRNFIKGIGLLLIAPKLFTGCYEYQEIGETIANPLEKEVMLDLLTSGNQKVLSDYEMKIKYKKFDMITGEKALAYVATYVKNGVDSSISARYLGDQRFTNMQPHIVFQKFTPDSTDKYLVDAIVVRFSENRDLMNGSVSGFLYDFVNPACFRFKKLENVSEYNNMLSSYAFFMNEKDKNN